MKIALLLRQNILKYIVEVYMWKEDYMYQLIFILNASLQIIALLLGGYFLLMSMASVIKRKEEDATKFKMQNKFAVLIPAHNEESVIAAILESVLAQNYKKDMFDVFVIADNCTDMTAKIACKYDVNVISRFNKTEIGKGYALDYAIKHIQKKDLHYDAFAFIDADNLVDPNFLLEMNKHLSYGHKVIQGYIDSKNPFDSWITASYTLAFSYINRIAQLSRYYLGLTNIINGSGFVVRNDIIQKYGWDAFTLTEDLEYTLRLNMRDIRVSFASKALVYSENPIDLFQSWKQRKRWTQGQVLCMQDYFVPLIKKAIKEKNIYAFDCAIYSFQAFRIMSLSLSFIYLFLPMFFKGVDLFSYGIIFPTSFWAVICFSQLVYGPILISCEKKLDMKLLITFILYPIYNLTWVPITVQSILDYENKEWFHTEHTRAMDMNDIVKVQDKD